MASHDSEFGLLSSRSPARRVARSRLLVVPHGRCHPLARAATRGRADPPPAPWHRRIHPLLGGLYRLVGTPVPCGRHRSPGARIYAGRGSRRRRAAAVRLGGDGHGGGRAAPASRCAPPVRRRTLGRHARADATRPPAGHRASASARRLSGACGPARLVCPTRRTGARGRRGVGRGGRWRCLGRAAHAARPPDARERGILPHGGPIRSLRVALSAA